jgi:hypothetical protein
MIQHIQVDCNTHDAITQAARDDGMSYDAKLALIVADWAATYRGRRQAHREFVQALENAYGVIPGGD